jgi:glutamate-ammonia-ligase adenylyltransferase
MPTPKRRSTNLPAKLRAQIEASPAPTLASAYLQRLLEASDLKSLNKIPVGEQAKLFRLLGSSAFLSDVLIRAGKQWPALFLRQIKCERKTAADHLHELAPAIKPVASFADFCTVLRRHKQREYLRIGARDLMPTVTMEETVRELTALADASLDAAYRFARAEVEKDFGRLNLPGTNNPNRFVVIGMGKLGGGELNFSSDVDVIFLYEDDEGESTGGAKGKTGAREFFSAIGQKIIHAMGDVSEDGFVFRIDLRLRPLGTNGPLVQSIDSGNDQSPTGGG